MWRQAKAHSIPALAFINKMDREGASFEGAVGSLQERLLLTPLPLQLPLLSPEGGLLGCVDLCSLEVLYYSSSGGGRGGKLRLQREPLEEAQGFGEFVGMSKEARAALVEQVAEMEGDGEVAESYLEEAPVTEAMLRAAVRR